MLRLTAPLRIGIIVTLLSLSAPLQAQKMLEGVFQQIADTLNGQLGVSVLHIESGTVASLNGTERFPMQSVYKFPIGLMMLRQIDAGRFALADTIHIDPSEYIPAHGHSPIRDRYPEGANLTLKEILEYNVSQSDGTACDVLLRLLGGTDEVQAKVQALGVRDIAIATTEMTQVSYDTVQYQNWTTPEAMNTLLQLFHSGDYLSESSQALLWDQMSISNQWFDRRIKGLLPAATPLAHKTGTAWTYNGLTRATNDAGILTLPDGSHLAISVFISDSFDSQQKREMTIAQAAKAAYDYWTEN